MALITFVPFAIIVLRLSQQEKLLVPLVVLQTLAANLGSEYRFLLEYFFDTVSHRVLIPRQDTSIGGVQSLSVLRHPKTRQADTR